LRILPQLDNLIKIDDDVTNDKYGYYPDKRPIESLMYYGLVLVDKPAGPTSHEAVAWIKRILEIEKAGHSGTLDPGATGLQKSIMRLRGSTRTFHQIS
jgi:H/ACA ribonucleoprotein complex subunit 4